MINFSAVAGLVYIFNELHFLPGSVFPIVFGSINAVGWYREYQKKNFGINYSVFTSITISLITLAFALELKTHLITSIWAIEASLLLYIWKKTNHKIFKIFFYVLFPMVIVSQMMTWMRYLDSASLNIIFNPVFITSLVVIGSCFMNLYLLKKDSEEEKSELEFYENIFKILCISVIYFSVLFEIIYHISDESFVFIMTIGFLFTIYYLFTLIVFGKRLSINRAFQTGMIYLLDRMELLVSKIEQRYALSDKSTADLVAIQTTDYTLFTFIQILIAIQCQTIAEFLNTDFEKETSASLNRRNAVHVNTVYSIRFHNSKLERLSSTLQLAALTPFGWQGRDATPGIAWFTLRVAALL
ncbi:MAG: hypothetical protein EOO19_15940, partial [Chryseobacterium sp.]